MEGFCTIVVKDEGPVHVYDVAALPVKFSVCPAQRGPLFAAVTVGKALTTTEVVLVLEHVPLLPVTV